MSRPGACFDEAMVLKLKEDENRIMPESGRTSRTGRRGRLVALAVGGLQRRDVLLAPATTFRFPVFPPDTSKIQEAFLHPSFLPDEKGCSLSKRAQKISNSNIIFQFEHQHLQNLTIKIWPYRCAPARACRRRGLSRARSPRPALGNEEPRQCNRKVSS